MFQNGPTEQSIPNNVKLPTGLVWSNVLFTVSEQIFFIDRLLCGLTMDTIVVPCYSHKPSFVLGPGKKPGRQDLFYVKGVWM